MTEITGCGSAAPADTRPRLYIPTALVMLISHLCWRWRRFPTSIFTASASGKRSSTPSPGIGGGFGITALYPALGT